MTKHAIDPEFEPILPLLPTAFDLSNAETIQRIRADRALLGVATPDRDDIVNAALSRLYAPNADNALCKLAFRDGTDRTVRAAEIGSRPMRRQIEPNPSPESRPSRNARSLADIVPCMPSSTSSRAPGSSRVTRNRINSSRRRNPSEIKRRVGSESLTTLSGSISPSQKWTSPAS